MDQTILSVKFFRTDRGNEPVREFLCDLTPVDRKIIGTDIKEVQFNWPIGMPLVRKMAKDLWEVRSHLEGCIARVLFTLVAGKWHCSMLLSRSPVRHPNQIYRSLRLARVSYRRHA